MNRLALIMAMAALWASQAMAQDDAPKQRPDRPRRMGQTRPAKPTDGAPRPMKPMDGQAQDKEQLERLQGVVNDLNLSADQQARVREILQAHRQAVQKWRQDAEEQLKTLAVKLQEARKARDEAAIKSLEEQRRKVWESRRQLHEDLMKQLSQVLNKEQMAKLRKVFQQRFAGGGRIMGALASLELTKEQKERIHEILQDARAKAEKAEGEAARGEIMRAAFEKIRKEVLTAEQRQKLEKTPPQQQHKPMLPQRLAGLNLTEQQKDQIIGILQEARLKAHKADSPEAKEQIHRQAMEKIIQDVLTEQQREQLKKSRRDGEGKDRGTRGDRPRGEGPGMRGDKPRGEADAAQGDKPRGERGERRKPPASEAKPN